jgi:hypothetical protein
LLPGFSARHAWISLPSPNFVLSTPDIDLDDAVTDLLFGIQGSSSLIHSTSMIKQSDVRQNRSQAVVSIRQVILQSECPPQFCNRFKMLKVLGGSL